MLSLKFIKPKGEGFSASDPKAYILGKDPRRSLGCPTCHGVAVLTPDLIHEDEVGVYVDILIKELKLISRKAKLQFKAAREKHGLLN